MPTPPQSVARATRLRSTLASRSTSDHKRTTGRLLRFACAVLTFLGATVPVLATASVAHAAGEPAVTWFGPATGSVVNGDMRLEMIAVPVDPAKLVKWCVTKDGVPMTTGITAINSPMLILPVGSGTFNPSTGCWTGANLWQAEFHIDTTTWPDGDHTYVVTVTDSLGATAGSGPITVTNINLPPTIHWDYPADHATLSGPDARFVASGGPDPKGTASVTRWCLLVDGAPATANWSVPQFLAPSTDIAYLGFDTATGCWTGLHIGSGELRVDTTKLINGSHTLTLISTDTSGRTSSDTIPFRASNRKAPTSITAGGRHSCARVVDGTVRCWGANDNGQLGDGTLIPHGTPTTTPGLEHVIFIAAGGNHTCAADAAGIVRCWGLNDNGQLGTGDRIRHLTPTIVTVVGGGPLTGATRVATGGAFTCAVVNPGADGTAYCWGKGSSGQLGNGTTSDSLVAQPVFTTSGALLVGVVNVSAGGGTACATLATGALRCWGSNTYGQVGDGTTTNRSRAVPVKGLDGLHAIVRTVAVGTSSTCARLSTNGIKCWGRNHHGQLGDGTTINRTSPTSVKFNAMATLVGAVHVAVGGAHACAIVGRAGTRAVWCWGQGADGQLGNGSTLDHHYATRITAATTANATQLACGAAHTLALVPSAVRPPTDVAAWGRNSSGQLGIGSVTPRLKPVVLTKIY